MIEFEFVNSQLLLIYDASNYGGVEWVNNELNSKGKVKIVKIFNFLDKDVVLDWNRSGIKVFLIAKLENDYFRIKKRILNTNHDVFLSQYLDISKKTFIAQKGISIFSKIDNVIDEPIVVGDDESSLPIKEFEKLLINFPTSTELVHYANSRITGIIGDYFETTTDAQKKLGTFLNRKKKIPAPSKVKWLNDYETQKYIYIRESFVEMLGNSDKHSEAEWQKLIAEFLLLIFPKYIAVIENVHVKDYYSNVNKTTDRYIDIALVDANGNIDIIEVKKPFENAVLSSGKYRGNYVPKRELSGSIVQVEKYIFHLGKSGRDGEKRIQDKFGHQLPHSLNVKITNPKGIVIVGRDLDFNEEQKFDFEIIKRKYANVMDIMTYDDILLRLDNIIEKYSVIN
jgi:hypothetical protein